MSNRTQPLRPPRLTGDPRADYSSLIEYLWAFWTAISSNYVNVDDVGDTVQPTTQMLTALAPLIPAADKLPYTTSSSEAELTDFTEFARTILDDADVIEVRSTLGLGALAQLSTVSTSYIDDDAVTYGKIQNVTASGVLLGRATAGAGNVEEILLGNIDHATLGNLNSTDYTHLTAANHTDLTDGGETTLHTHASSGFTHNSLSGLQGGTVAEYYHLTSAEHSAVHTAGSDDTFTVSGEVSDTTCYPLFVTAETGDLGPKTNAGLSFNSATATLSATGFSGPLTGNVTGDCSGSSGSTTGNAATATALATARAINGVNFDGSAAITVPVNNTDDTTTAAIMYPLFTATVGGNYDAKVSSTKYRYNPSNGTLTVTAITSALTGSATSLKSPATTGLARLTGMGAGTTRDKTVSDANDTILELGGSYTPGGTWNWTSATVTWPTFNQNTSGTAANVTGTVAITNGGTGQTTAQAAIDALSAVAAATNEYVLTKDTATGNALWKAAGATAADMSDIYAFAAAHG